jgi:hypothetical protein
MVRLCRCDAVPRSSQALTQSVLGGGSMAIGPIYAGRLDPCPHIAHSVLPDDSAHLNYAVRPP